MATTKYTFSAGEMKPFPKCKFFKIKSAAGPLLCVFYSNNGSEIGRADLVQGDAINDPEGFATVEVTSATAQAVEIHTLPFLLSTNSLVGDVNALTRFANKTEDGNQFMTGIYLTGSAGNYSHVAFLNPMGSNVVLDFNVTRVSAFGERLGVREITPADFTLLTDAGFLSNKDIGAVVSKSKQGLGSIGSQLGTGILSLPTATDGTPMPLDYGSAPISISPGVGVVFVPDAVATGCAVFLECEERSL